MNIWHDISPKRITPDDFFAVIEISKGDKNKYELAPLPTTATRWMCLCCAAKRSCP